LPQLIDLILKDAGSGQTTPWPRAVVTPAVWHLASERLEEGRWTLLGLWAEPKMVHMALLDNAASHTGIVSLACPEGRYPSVGQFHPPALRLERAIRDLFGIEPEGIPDTRPWLDHGQWGITHPLGEALTSIPQDPRYRFLPSKGESLHQIPVGPVHAGIIEPGHFRFTANGETVVRLEERLGYVHKGTEGLMIGADLKRGSELAGRVSGDSVVAYQLAFARAAEEALGLSVPPRAHWLRAMMAELERLANHLGDIGAICNDASFSLIQAHCAALREEVLRAADQCFGHRLMRDQIVPGGVARDPGSVIAPIIRALIDYIGQKFPPLVELYDNTASLQDRTVGTGTLTAGLARQYGAGGYVGRASGRDFDTRRAIPYPPYDQLTFKVPMLEEGDVNARVWIRIREVEQSLSLIEQISVRLPDGPTMAEVKNVGAPCEGLAIVEGFRGDILVWLSLAADGRISRCHLRDPSWFQWPLIEAAIEGNIVADFPLCNKSFNCAYSGHDL
jgi:Ni,Fe-hydrogenase III large subunit